MKWDKKLIFYLALMYFIYALSNTIALGDFVPPIPIFPFLIPFLALCFIVKTPFSIYSFLMIFIAVGIPIHMFIFIHPLLIKWFSFLAISSLLIAGIMLWRCFYLNDNKLYNYLFGLVMMLSPFLILDNYWLKYIYFIGIGLSAIICLKSQVLYQKKLLSEYRFILYMTFISSLYMINLIALISFKFFNN